jgi:hypothetical protein
MTFVGGYEGATGPLNCPFDRVKGFCKSYQRLTPLESIVNLFAFYVQNI